MNCKQCNRPLSNPNYKTYNLVRTGFCITCFNQKRLGEKNPAWKGEGEGGVAYAALHAWVRRRFPRPEVCTDCKKGFPMDLANISQEYKRELSDWEWLCRKCHMKQDGRTGKGWKTNRPASNPLLVKTREDWRKYSTHKSKG